MADRPEAQPAVAAENHEQQASDKLLQATVSESPEYGGFGPWIEQKLREAGKPVDNSKTDDKWTNLIAERDIDKSTGSVSYLAQIDGKKYADIPNDLGSGKDGVYEIPDNLPKPDPGKVNDADWAGPLPKVETGSAEYNKVVDLVHNQLNFDDIFGKMK